jgi:hypothetical protein
MNIGLVKDTHVAGAAGIRAVVAYLQWLKKKSKPWKYICSNTGKKYYNRQHNLRTIIVPLMRKGRKKKALWFFFLFWPLKTSLLTINFILHSLLAISVSLMINGIKYEKKWSICT